MNKEELEQELATIKVMIYSLHTAIDDIVKTLKINDEGIDNISTWEKECRESAKKILKRAKGEEYD